MAPIIHCVRHAQGFHNLSIASHAIRDPLLTPFGQQQCEELQHNFPHHENVELIVASPLRRTLYTALLSFEDDIKNKNITVVALPDTQETSDLPCDTGVPVQDLAHEFEGQPVDLSLLDETWGQKQSRWAPTAKAIEARAKAARQWLMARGEKEVVLVTHGKSSDALIKHIALHELSQISGGFLHYFTEDWAGCDKYAGTGWANTEYRSYSFVESGDGEAHLKETADSYKRRAGDVRFLTPSEQADLRRSAELEWDRDGYVLQQPLAQHIQGAHIKA
jgi:broad specificity phosphatase PhoE